VGQRLLEERMAGFDEDTCAAAERARGRLPPGRLGATLLDRIRPQVEQIVEAARQETASGGEPTSLEVAVRLDDGGALVGTVPGVAGDCLTSVAYSRVGAKHRLVAWARLLAATAAHPERPWEAVTIGKRIRAGNGVSVVRIPALADTAGARRRVALAELAVLVDLYRRGICEPLPLFCDTSFGYANAAARGWDAANHAGQSWTSGYQRDREDKEAEHQLVLGGVAALDDLLGAALRDDECGDGWPDEPSRLGRYARRLWDPLLAREEVDNR